VTKPRFEHRGGHFRPRDADKYRIVEQDQPLWLVPKPGVRGFKRLKFYVYRLFNQKPEIWGGFGPMSVFYRHNGTLKLKPYQHYMYHSTISYIPLITASDECLNE